MTWKTLAVFGISAVALATGTPGVARRNSS